MADILQKYRFRCLTEGVDKEVWATEPPQTCPHAGEDIHDISHDSIAVVDSYDPGASSVHLAGFVDRSGHNYFKKGIYGVAAPGSNAEPTATDLLINFPSDMLLCGGGYRVCENADHDDKLNVDIIDHYGLLGYGPNFPLVTFIETNPIWPEATWELLLDDAKELPSVFFLRMRYIAHGSKPVRVAGWYHMRTTP
jgi:hypothetical protein